MSKIAYVIDYISKRNPIHTKKLKKTLCSLGSHYDRRAEEFLGKHEVLLKKEGKTLDFAIECYLKMLADITMETLRFRETGEYSSKSFEDVNRRVYGNSEVMEYYMHALLLSQFLWKHHFAMFDFFTRELTKRIGSVRSYLEIGGGHGLQVAEAAKILGAGSRITVVDISPTALDLSRRMVDDDSVSFVLSDVFEYRPNGKFDFISVGEVLEHLENPGALLNCVSDLLADHGTLFITTPANAPTIDHIYLFKNADEIRTLIHNAGLAVEAEFCQYAEDVDREKADKYKITLLYGACLKGVQPERF